MGKLVDIHFFVEEPINHPLCTIRDRYRHCGINPSVDWRGVVDIQEAPHCNGLEVWARSDLGTRTLSLNSHIRPLSMNDLRTRGLMLPLRWGEEDKMRTLTKGEDCAVLGNAARWKDIERNGAVQVGTLWRSTRLILRGWK